MLECVRHATARSSWFRLQWCLRTRAPGSLETMPFLALMVLALKLRCRPAPRLCHAQLCSRRCRVALSAFPAVAAMSVLLASMVFVVLRSLSDSSLRLVVVLADDIRRACRDATYLLTQPVKVWMLTLLSAASASFVDSHFNSNFGRVHIS